MNCFICNKKMIESMPNQNNTIYYDCINYLCYAELEINNLGKIVSYFFPFILNNKPSDRTGVVGGRFYCGEKITAFRVYDKQFCKTEFISVSNNDIKEKLSKYANRVANMLVFA